MGIEISSDRRDKFWHAEKIATTDCLIGNQGEKSFYLIEPRGMRRGEMKVPVRPFDQPLHDRRRLVGGVVIQNKVYLFAGGNILRNVLFNLS